MCMDLHALGDDSRLDFLMTLRSWISDTFARPIAFIFPLKYNSSSSRYESMKSQLVSRSGSPDDFLGSIDPRLSRLTAHGK